MRRTTRACFVALVICLPLIAGAQEKQRFSSLDEALQAERFSVAGRGPRM